VLIDEINVVAMFELVVIGPIMFAPDFKNN
jgi:hypothetical protein